MKHLDAAQLDHYIDCAREYATQFNIDTFAIYHLARALETDFRTAKELFYNHVLTTP